MKKTYSIGVCTLIGLAICSVVVVRSQSPSGMQVSRTALPVAPPQIPDVIFYGETFSLLSQLKNIEDYKREADLTDTQAQTLLSLSEDCQNAVKELDREAQKIIVAAHEKTKDVEPSTTPRRPPKELLALQARRNQIILEYRDLLQKRIGEDKFSAFRSAAQRLVHISIKPSN